MFPVIRNKSKHDNRIGWTLDMPAQKLHPMRSRHVCRSEAVGDKSSSQRVVKQLLSEPASECRHRSSTHSIRYQKNICITTTRLMHMSEVQPASPVTPHRTTKRLILILLQTKTTQDGDYHRSLTLDSQSPLSTPCGAQHRISYQASTRVRHVTSCLCARVGVGWDSVGAC